MGVSITVLQCAFSSPQMSSIKPPSRPETRSDFTDCFRWLRSPIPSFILPGLYDVLIARSSTAVSSHSVSPCLKLLLELLRSLITFSSAAHSACVARKLRSLREKEERGNRRWRGSCSETITSSSWTAAGAGPNAAGQ